MHLLRLLGFFFQAEDGIRDLVRSRGLGDVYKRQVLNVAFVEYAQSRGFLIDPARVRAPQDKGRVERAVQFVQTSFWAGEDFGCLVEAQTAAELWCRSRAGLRTHGSTQAQPAVVFAKVEAPVLLPAPAGRYGCPLYTYDAAHGRSRVNLGGVRFIKTKK